MRFEGAKTRVAGDELKTAVNASLRDIPGLRPTTSELLDCLKLLLNEDVSPEALREREAKKLIPPLHGALLKNEQDVRKARFLTAGSGSRIE